MNVKLVAYSSDFVSFLIQELGSDLPFVKQIILFGSAARGEAGKDSDVDLFVDVTKERLEKKIQKARDDFYGSVKMKGYWSFLGVKNEINCSIGKLDTWHDLERSIIANGIVLYGKYMGVPKTERFYLFIVTPGKERNKNLSVWRSLYGYRQTVGRKIYSKKGLVAELSGKKLARAVFMLPAGNTDRIGHFLRQNKFEFRIIPFWQEV